MLHDLMIDRFLHIQVNFSYIFSMVQVNFTDTVLHSVASGVHAFKIMLSSYKLLISFSWALVLVCSYSCNKNVIDDVLVRII